jgi:hypothetical protein
LREKAALRGAHRRGGGDSDDAQQKSDVRERPPVGRSSGPGAGTVGRDVVLERGGGAGSVMREWMSGGSAVLLSELGRRRG